MVVGLDNLGPAVSTAFWLLVMSLIGAAGFNMATNRRGKADQLARDYRETLDRDRQRGLRWLHWNAAASASPRTYQALGWVLVVISVAAVLGVVLGVKARLLGG